MELTRPGYAVVYVILLCALAQGGSEGKRAEDEDFPKDVVLSSSSSSHAEQGYIVWKNCRKELTERNNDAKDFDFQAQLRSSDKRSTFLIENNINKASKLLPPQLIKNNIVGCLRISACPHAPISELRASSRHQLVSGRGRYLISEEQSSADAPSLALEPSSSDDDGDRDHDFILPQNIFEPSPLSLSPPPPPHKANLHVAASPGNNNGSGNQQTAIIVAGVVSGITMVVGMLLCYRVVKEGRVENESGSLLALTSKDYTGGPPKVVHLGDVDSKYSKEESTIENVMGNEKSTSTVKISISKVEDNINILLVETTSSEAVEKVAPPPAAKPPPPLLGPPAAPPPPALAPRPPPPPRAGHPPPAPPKAMIGKKQLEPKEGDSSDGDAAKPKLKPFFWDKVTAKPDQSMVWHEISGGSFVFNEEKMESLFGCANQNRPERKKDSPSLDNTVHYIQIIDPKKAQNLSILLRALNVTTNEVVDALKEGNKLPFELIQTLLKMAPTAEEELKLRLFTGDLSQLGPAERFLKVLVDIPFAFKRLESLMFMFIFPEETTSIKDCFATLEVACNKLRKSRLFLKLLEAVLKTGNRMNDGTYRGGAQAFRLDTLLKLSDVKGTDGKTTLLHFVVQEIIRSEGIRAARTAKESNSSMSSVKTEDIDYDVEQTAEHYRSLGLQVVSGLSTELDDVKKAAIVDGDALSSAVSKLHLSLTKTQEFLNTDLKNIEEDSEFQRCIERFVETAKSNVAWLVDEDKRIMALVKSTADYFHGNAGKDEGLRLFLTVRDFLIILDKVCKEVNEASVKAAKASMRKDTSSSSVSSSPDTRQQSSPTTELHKRLFPAIAERRVDYDSSSDDDT